MFLVTQTLQHRNESESVEMPYTRSESRVAALCAAVQAMEYIGDPEYADGHVRVLSVRIDWTE